MLYSLKIENIAVIESAEIEFGNGFNVLTGETGAGKSIIIDSLCAVLGERTSRELIRSGADFARVSAVFEKVSADVLDELKENGISADETTLVLTRTIYTDGRNVCRINGCPANVGMLKSLGTKLVNIHGQHDSQALLMPDKHIYYLDSIADNQAVRTQYKECFSRLIKVKHSLDSLYTDENAKALRLDYLDFQINELQNASLRAGERDELNQRKIIIQNSKKIKKQLEQAYNALSCEETGASDRLKLCAEALDDVSKYSKEADYAVETAHALFFEVNDLASNLRNTSEKFDFSESELAQIDERLDVIYRITHKFGGSEESALDALNDMIAEREQIYNSEQNTQQLEEELNQLGDKIKKIAYELTESRKRAGAFFEKRVCDELEFLEMPSVKFKVDIKESSYSSRGADNVEFLISANAGEELRPLAKIASGGELSRIMLAIKNVISDKDDIDTLIFDEIDSGVSGRAAQKIALKIKEVSRNRQVICVTHLAQIAACADEHLKIAKSVNSGKTFTIVDKLDFEGRKNELARIMGGLEITNLQLENAHEMLISAGIYWD